MEPPSLEMPQRLDVTLGFCGSAGVMLGLRDLRDVFQPYQSQHGGSWKAGLAMDSSQAVTRVTSSVHSLQFSLFQCRADSPTAPLPLINALFSQL